MWDGKLGQREERKYIQDGREGQEVHGPLQGSSTFARLMDTRIIHYSPETRDPNFQERVAKPKKTPSQLKYTEGYRPSGEKSGKAWNSTVFSQQPFLAPAQRLTAIRVHSHSL